MSSITDQNFRFRFSAASELKTVIDQLKEIDSLTQEQVTTSRNAATSVRAVRDAESAKAKAQALEDAIIARNIAAQTTIEVNAEARKQTIYAKAQADQNTLYAEAHAAKQIALAKVTAEEEIALNKAVARQLAAEAERQEAEKLSKFRANLARQEALLRDSIEDNISLYRRQTAEFNEEQKRQTAEFRGEQTRQTMLLRDELREQRTAFEGHGNAVRDLRNLIASAFGAHEVLQFTKDVVDAKSKIDVFKAGMEQLIGSKAEANALYNDIVRLAKTTPFEIEKLTDVVFTMKGMGVETAKLLPTLEALGNMAAVVGQEKLGLIAKAFTDVQSKGKLMKQEINQFAENGVPLYDLLAKSMGKTRDEVVKMAEAHTISFADVERSIMLASQKGGVYYNLMILQSQTLGGQVSNLADKFFLAKAKVGDFFEGPLKKGISTLADLVEGLMGSDAAINRTLDGIKAAGAAWLTYNIAMTLVSAQKKIAANETARLTVAETLLTANTAAMSLGFNSAASGARALWVAFAANPLGAFISLVSLATSAWFAYDAASTKVTESVSVQEAELRKEQATMQGLVDAALKAKMGTDQRRDSILLLIKEYPSYFAGLDAEKTTNQQLRSILNSVNKSYQDRIAVAREAYNVDKLATQQKAYFDKEKELITRYTKDLSGEMVDYIGNDINKLQAMIKKFPEEFRTVNFSFAGALGFDVGHREVNQVASGLKKIEGEMAASEVRIANFQEGAGKTRLDAENARSAAVLGQVKKGSSEYLAEIKLHAKNVAQIQGDSADTEIKTAEKVKNLTLATAAERRVVTTAEDAKDLKSKLAHLDALEKAEIESVNKITVRKKASNAEIEALTEVALSKVAEIHKRYNLERETLLFNEAQKMSAQIDAEIKLMEIRGFKDGEFTTGAVKNIQTLISEKKKEAQQIVEAQKQIDAARKESAEIDKETSAIMAKSNKDNIGLIFDLAGKQSSFLGEISRAAKAAWLDMDLISGKAVTDAKTRLDTAEMQLFTIKRMFNDGTQDSELKIANAEKAVANAGKNVAELTAGSATATLGMVSVVMQVVQALSQALEEMYAETYRAIADALDSARTSYVNFYDTMLSVSKSALAEEMANFTGSWEERERVMNDYFASQNELAQRRDAVDAHLAFQAEIARAQAEAGTNAKKMMEGLIEAQKNNLLRQQEMIINQANEEIQQATIVRDQKLKLIDEQVSAFKTARDKEIELLQDNLTRQKALNDQFFSDKTLRLQEDDTYRALLLQQGEAREVANLAAARDREIKRAEEQKASAEEIAQIRNAFEKLIADKHKEYEDAKAEKTKQVSLATQEIKAQEADKITQIENNTATQITNLQNQITANEAAAANDKKRVNEEYARAKLAAERTVFEAQKAMAIAELQAQIAILQSKKWALNRGKMNEAINDISAAINDINNINFGAGAIGGGVISSGTLANILTQLFPGGGNGVGSTPTTLPGTPTTPVRSDTGATINVAYDKDGNIMELTFNPSGKQITAYDDNGNPIQIAYADGYVPVTGQRYAKGTPYVDGPYPNGIDTVPSWLTKGERVFTVDENRQLKGMSNEQVVQTIQQMEQLQLDLSRGAFADIRALNFGQSGSNTTNPNGLDLSPLVAEMQETRKTMANLKQLHLTIDRNGFAQSEIGKGSIIKHYANRMQR